jgi:HEAT repeat protein
VNLLLLLLACVPKPTTPVATGEIAAAAAPLPPDIRVALEEGAADLDVSVRRRAIATLVAVDPAPAGGAWGPRGRLDPSEYVRRATVEALATRITEPASRDLLAAILQDTSADPWTRGAAALALLGNPAGVSPEHRAAVAAAAGGVRGTRAAALLLAAAAGGDTTARDRLVRMLEGGGLPLELWFLRALGASGEAAFATGLRAGFDRVEPEVQLAAAVALLELGDATGERALATALAGEDEERALEAVELLSFTSPTIALPLLRGAATAGPAVVGAADAVRFGHGDGAARAVLDALASDEPEVRVYAARAAARRLADPAGLDGADRVRAALRAALPEADAALQLALVEALGADPGPADRELLRTLLRDESTRVRVEAASVLAR